MAEDGERIDPTTCELVPYWHADTDEHKIERLIAGIKQEQHQKATEELTDADARATPDSIREVFEVRPFFHILAFVW